MKLSQKAKTIFKQVGVDLDTYKVNPNKKFNPKTAPGLKKGSGGVDGAALAAGVAEGSVEFIRGLMLEAIEDITDTDDAKQELKTHGYLDDTGETTEFGQRFYQQAVASLNEYHIIHELLLRD